MFCPNCGTQVPNGTSFCPNCGSPLLPEGNASQPYPDAAGQSGAPVNPVQQPYDQQAYEQQAYAQQPYEQQSYGAAPGPQPYASGAVASGPIQEDRSLAMLILLSIVTCGIYGYYYVYTMARDINIICADDDEETGGLAVYILLSLVTCGFYSLYWEYKLGNRIARNAPSYGLTIQENGTTILMWRVLGSLVCVIGSFYGQYLLLNNMNQMAHAYNVRNGYAV